MKYGKLIDGTLISAPMSLVQDGYRVHNPPAEMYATHGYLPVAYIERPDDGTYETRWIEQDGVITNEWVEIIEFPPPEPTPEERIAALEEQLKAAKILLGVE